MHLFDPLRPKLPNSRPTWFRNNIAISHFEIFPREDGNLDVSIWLPLKDETFASKRFTKILEPIALHGLIQNFINNPEETCEFLFKNEPQGLQPELRNNIRYETDPDAEVKTIKNTNPVRKPNQPLNLEF